MSVRWKLSAIAFLCFISFPLQAEGWKPTGKMAAIFNPKNQENLCGGDNVVDERFLLYEIANQYDLNAAELSRKSANVKLENGARIPKEASYEVIMAGWLTHRMVTETEGLSKNTAENLQHAQIELQATIKDWITTEKIPGYQIKVNSYLSEQELNAVYESTAKANTAVFSETLGDRYNSVSIDFICAPLVSSGAGSASATGAPIQKAGFTNPIWAVRSESDDIAIRRIDKGAFKKLDPATISYTDNRADNKKTTTADLAIGVGKSWNAVDHFYGFLAYKNNDTDTATPDDDDTSKDINALSLGAIWARAPDWRIGSLKIFPTFGVTAYATSDSAQDSETARFRMFANDIAFNSPGTATALCGRHYHAMDGFLFLDCRASAFVELARVIDAGTSKDLETLEDDNYAGIGAQVVAIFGFGAKSSFLNPFQFRFSYRYMNVFYGDLDNPDLKKASLAYKVPDTNFEVALTYEKGRNFDTFAAIDTLKFSAGWKY